MDLNIQLNIIEYLITNFCFCIHYLFINIRSIPQTPFPSWFPTEENPCGDSSNKYNSSNHTKYYSPGWKTPTSLFTLPNFTVAYS